MFEYIPPNVWRHSPEYNVPPIPRVPRIPFLAPLFLVLYIALLLQIVVIHMGLILQILIFIVTKENSSQI